MQPLKSLALIAASRNLVLELTKSLTIEQMNFIPTGMNNNIIWHMAHLITVEQDRCYSQSGISPLLPESFMQAYRPGTKPLAPADRDFCDMVKESLLNNISVISSDYEKGIFNGYEPFVSKAYPGVEVNNIEDALEFVLLHEGVHQGCIRALFKLIS